jgi:hypothetical protein
MIALPCPNRDVWLKARDKLYDEIQTKGYNHEQQFFGPSRFGQGRDRLSARRRPRSIATQHMI